MFNRRRLLVSVVALAGCAPREPALASIWLHVVPDGSGYALSVEGDVVSASELEQALLDHAIAANPGLTSEAARQQVRIYVRSEPGVPDDWVEDLMPVLSRFGRVGFVAEDRR